MMNELREPDLPCTGKRCAHFGRRTPSRNTGPRVADAAFVLSRNTRNTRNTRSNATLEAAELTEIATRARSGKPASAARLGEANTALRVYELWDNAGVLFANAEAFREQTARALKRYAQAERGGAVSVRAAPVEFTGLVRVGANARGEEIGDAGHG